jgi:hypothetical protein
MKLFYLTHPNELISHHHSSQYLNRLALLYGWGQSHYDVNGKPHVELGYVSISHSRHHFICVHAAHPIGIDMEIERTLSQTLIERFQLESSKPLLDWCRREAFYKLSQSKEHVFKPIPSDVYADDFKYNGCLIVIVSMHTLPKYELIELSSDFLETD